MRPISPGRSCGLLGRRGAMVVPLLLWQIARVIIITFAIFAAMMMIGRMT
jgi:hypothetical protein